MSHDVFISYSSKDKSIADAICGTLEGKKFRCWIAPRDVLPGVPYGEALVEAIEASQVIVLVFSSSANSSPQVMREVERAVSKGIPIIPLRIEQVPPSKSSEFFISAPHWLDAMTPPLEKHLQSLAETVHLLLARHGKRGDTQDGETVDGRRQVEAAVGNLPRPSSPKKPPALQPPPFKRPMPTARAAPSATSRKPPDRTRTVLPTQPVSQETITTSSQSLWMKRLCMAFAFVVLIVMTVFLNWLHCLREESAASLLLAVLMLLGLVGIWWCPRNWRKWWFESLIVALLFLLLDLLKDQSLRELSGSDIVQVCVIVFVLLADGVAGLCLFK